MVADLAPAAVALAALLWLQHRLPAEGSGGEGSEAALPFALHVFAATINFGAIGEAIVWPGVRRIAGV